MCWRATWALTRRRRWPVYVCPANAIVVGIWDGCCDWLRARLSASLCRSSRPCALTGLLPSPRATRSCCPASTPRSLCCNSVCRSGALSTIPRRPEATSLFPLRCSFSRQAGVASTSRLQSKRRRWQRVRDRVVTEEAAAPPVAKHSPTSPRPLIVERATPGVRAAVEAATALAATMAWTSSDSPSWSCHCRRTHPGPQIPKLPRWSGVATATATLAAATLRTTSGQMKPPAERSRSRPPQAS
mmetsp:Transcript_82995/g.231608  ORF Transcript_82995/g.231608 Transcript_82995/m.231608 type:complete len:243 (-) Transcript_82995:1379-2107(-)